ncbi:MAG: DNA repair protein RadA [Elusimicrobiaceae bacterium]|nr:DNA repair protein RadA [Elusimicrobiaceae bacterium]
MKFKTVYKCQSCGQESAKWLGQCPGCGEWNTLAEEVEASGRAKAGERRSLTEFSSGTVKLAESGCLDEARIKTGLSELDRLLGEGLIRGQMVLLAGAPGIGKSTLMMQIAGALAKDKPLLYVTGEESVAQVGSRAARLKVASDNIYLLSETDLSKIAESYRKIKPAFMIIDSIQTVFHPELAGSSGTVGQIRESASELLRMCKPDGTVLFVLGHVTKDGGLAGPKVLEHIVDTVLYFDTERYSFLRMLRAHKNRFGPTDELGIFRMTETGLSPVDDASGYFATASRTADLCGRAYTVAMEGTRPIFTEVQVLVTPTRYPFPQRMATGVDLNRCRILLAAIEKHLGISLESRDVFINLPGGLKVKDPALDLAVCAAVISSAREIPLPHDAVFIGETGILGQISQAAWLSARLKEAGRLGLGSAYIPRPAGGSELQTGALSLIILEELEGLMRRIDTFSRKRSSAAD